MQKENLLTPDYLFEVSWEVCNKVGGIHTVIATKIPTLKRILKKPHILIGPDVVRENDQNSEFQEDPLLMKAWRAKAANEGLRIRIGRWNIAEQPIAILIDFTTFFPQKDDIFSKLWEQYKLDSISGQWDYVEPALFGYAAGKVIESYIKYHCSPNDKIIAQFHEWMTGTGLLYLKANVSQVGCAFTTHATVLGRCIAGNNLPLYDKLKEYNPDTVARNFGVEAKQSLEKLAAQTADAFTTVSDITARECEQFLSKPVDIVTPNGFQDFIKEESELQKKQQAGRDALIKVAEGILARPVSKDALVIGTSGRYEFKNKGIDVFINALGKANKENSLNKEIIAFILVPAGHHGPIDRLLKNMDNPEEAQPLANPYLSHELNDEQYDPVLNTIRNNQLNNSVNDKSKIFFIPSYLNGNDGIFNMPYYDLLAGIDLSLFPSYYEPWGYTPLESVAFRVPTITTTLAGFGLWVETHFNKEHPGVTVVKRTDSNDEEVIDKIKNDIITYTKCVKEEVSQVRNNAYEVSKIALWDNLITYYLDAYDGALNKVSERYSEKDFIVTDPMENYIKQTEPMQDPNWFSVVIRRDIPEKLKALETLSMNMWWCWNQDAIDLFRSIDPVIWERSYYNPIVLLDTISYQKYQDLVNDQNFIDRLSAVYSKFESYMNQKPTDNLPAITYFCMEYGLHSSLKIYSGGLGILAGDYLKEASDKNVRMTGVGLLYRYGYFRQRLSTGGEQENIYEAQQFDKIPVSPLRDEDGNWITIQIALHGRNMNARAWKVDVGRIELLLLDTDYEDNLPEDRNVTYHLYGGDWENRLKQELLLGIGGIRLLQKLGRKSDVYHCNEGHAAFTGLERIHMLMKEKHLSFAEAKEVVRSSSLFTTHTPVPAGHDAFDEGLLRKYIAHYPERFDISWDYLMGLGRMYPADHNEKFSMSNLAVNLSQEVNGVSWLHGKVSQEMFNGMFPGYLVQESYIGYVTNGVHYPTWAAPQWKRLYERVFGEAFATHHYDKTCFANIQNVEDKEIWNIRTELRSVMVEKLKQRLKNNENSMYYSPREIVEILHTLDPNKLTFGFARRFATYKRAQLLFKNLDTLNQIVNHPTRPVQFIFAGKAHPADKAGQDLIKKIVEISKYPQFLGKILFIENYDMELASTLVQGVDIWLNTPTRPMEASGTSGEKAVMNGVMHFSVLDGWWVEGYRKDAGWALPLEQVYENNDYQNELDAELIYSTIENEIAPLYYDKSADELPHNWIQHIKNSIDKVASNFTMNRQLTDYEDKFYNKLFDRSIAVKKENYAMAKEIVLWKNKVAREWENVEVIHAKIPSIYKEQLVMGQEYEMEITLSCGSVSPEDIGVELISVRENEKHEKEILHKKSFALLPSEGGSVGVYQLKYSSEESGAFLTGIRIYAKNKLLAHQQDSGLVKWI